MSEFFFTLNVKSIFFLPIMQIWHNIPLIYFPWLLDWRQILIINISRSLEHSSCRVCLSISPDRRICVPCNDVVASSYSFLLFVEFSEWSRVKMNRTPRESLITLSQSFSWSPTDLFTLELPPDNLNPQLLFISRIFVADYVLPVFLQIFNSVIHSELFWNLTCFMQYLCMLNNSFLVDDYFK